MTAPAAQRANGSHRADDTARIPSDRRRAGQLLAQLWPASFVATQIGVAESTVARWAEQDPDFQAGYAEEADRSARAAERQRVKILMELDGIVDRALEVTRDTAHRDWARMSMYLVDKVMIPQSIQHNTTDFNVEVAFHAALAATIEKVLTVRAGHNSRAAALDASASASTPFVSTPPAAPNGGGLPALLTGEAAAESYGAKSLKVPAVLRDNSGAAR